MAAYSSCRSSQKRLEKPALNSLNLLAEFCNWAACGILERGCREKKNEQEGEMRKERRQSVTEICHHGEECLVFMASLLKFPSLSNLNIVTIVSRSIKCK